MFEDGVLQLKHRREASPFVTLPLLQIFVIELCKKWMDGSYDVFSWSHGGSFVLEDMREDWTLISCKQQVLCLHRSNPKELKIMCKKA